MRYCLQRSWKTVNKGKNYCRLDRAMYECLVRFAEEGEDHKWQLKEQCTHVWWWKG
jgi:hypothetical protein